MARGRVEAVKHGGARGHCEKGRNGRRSKIQGARGPSMKSHLFNGRNFSNERSHLPRAFSSSIGFLADRAPPLPTTQTPLNPPRWEGCFSSLLFFLSFFLSSFFRRTKVNGWNEKLVKGERHRWAWSVSVFFNHPEKELERVASYVWIGQMLEWKGWARTCSRLSVARVSQLFVQRSRVLDVLHEACEHGFSRSFGVVGRWFATIDMGKGQ